MYTNKHSEDATEKFLVIVALIFAIIAFGFPAFSKVMNEREVVITVTDKDVKMSGSDEAKYLVFGRDENDSMKTFEVTDSWLHGRFNSSDVYGGIEVGKTYTFTVCGYRVPFLSMYPNLYEYEEVTTQS